MFNEGNRVPAGRPLQFRRPCSRMATTYKDRQPGAFAIYSAGTTRRLHGAIVMGDAARRSDIALHAATRIGAGGFPPRRDAATALNDSTRSAGAAPTRYGFSISTITAPNAAHPVETHGGRGKGAQHPHVGAEKRRRISQVPHRTRWRRLAEAADLIIPSLAWSTCAPARLPDRQGRARPMLKVPVKRALTPSPCADPAHDPFQKGAPVWSARTPHRRLSSPRKITAARCAPTGPRGFGAIVCNRPDEREPGTPFAAIRCGGPARRGLEARHQPVVPGQGDPMPTPPPFARLLRN